MTPRNKRLRSALAGLLFFGLAIVIAALGLRFKINDSNYWMGFIGLGLFLEAFYLTLHFLLKTVFFFRPHIAKRSSQILAGLVAFVLSLITTMLTLLIVQSLRVIVDAATLAVTGVVAVALAAPALFLWWFAIGFFRSRA